MADIAKTGTPSLSDVLPPANDRLSELLAGEAIAAGDVCYIKSDGKAWLCDGSAADALAEYVGVALKAAGVGEAITLGHGVTLRYGAGLTPGDRYFVSVTAGAIADAASTGGTVPVAFAVNATEIYFLHPTR